MGGAVSGRCAEGPWECLSLGLYDSGQLPWACAPVHSCAGGKEKAEVENKPPHPLPREGWEAQGGLGAPAMLEHMLASEGQHVDWVL